MSAAAIFAVNPANASFIYTTRIWHRSTGTSSSFSLRPSAHSLQAWCCSGSRSNSRGRGFSPSSKKPAKRERQGDESSPSSSSSAQSRKTSSGTRTTLNRAPGLSSQIDGKSNSFSIDNEFEERLQAVKRVALQQKKAEEEKNYKAIDYDAPTETKSSNVSMAAKIGAGAAVVVFGIVFAFGDFLPSGSVSPVEEATKLERRISSEERANLKMKLQQFEEALSANPEDPIALEGAAVTFTELGEYNQAVSLLEDLSKKKPSDPAVFRLLGEVKYQLQDYEGCVRAYRMCAMVSKGLDLEVLRGLTNALLAAKRPSEAVQELLASRARLEEEIRVTNYEGAESNPLKENPVVDHIQLDLLLGKAYSDWGHVSDAISVYDQIISKHPDDFRGYLAKGVILKENGSVGDAERMFIQARFFAPEKAKALVDRYSR